MKVRRSEVICARCREWKSEKGVCDAQALMAFDAIWVGDDWDRKAIPPRCPYILEHVIESH